MALEEEQVEVAAEEEVEVEVEAVVALVEVLAAVVDEVRGEALEVGQVVEVEVVEVLEVVVVVVQWEGEDQYMCEALARVDGRGRMR